MHFSNQHPIEIPETNLPGNSCQLLAPSFRQFLGSLGLCILILTRNLGVEGVCTILAWPKLAGVGRSGFCDALKQEMKVQTCEKTMFQNVNFS